VDHPSRSPGSTLARAGNFAEAEAELRTAVVLKPDYAEGWNFLGEFIVCFRQRDRLSGQSGRLL
jgi:Flp pilus assembly protein TadD